VEPLAPPVDNPQGPHQVRVDWNPHQATLPDFDLHRARHTLEWALAMYQSAKERAPVELPLRDEDAVW